MADLKLAGGGVAFTSISMGAVGKHNMSLIDCQKILAIWVASEHFPDWQLKVVMTKDERLWRMTTEMVQQMQGSQEVGPAGQIHKLTQALDAKDLLAASAGEPVKATNCAQGS